MTPAWTDADGAELDVLVHALVFDYWEHRKHCEAYRPERCPDLEAWKAHKAECRAVRVTRRSPSGSRASATSNSSITTVAAARAACRARSCRPRSAKSATGARHACCSHGPRGCEQSSRGVRCERLALTGRPRRAPGSVHRVPHTGGASGRRSLGPALPRARRLRLHAKARAPLPREGIGQDPHSRGTRARRAGTDAHRQRVRRRPTASSPTADQPSSSTRPTPTSATRSRNSTRTFADSSTPATVAEPSSTEEKSQARPSASSSSLHSPRAHSQELETYQTRSSTAPSSSR